ncbi:hypothetical protein BDN70DRAFT_768221, partial [Pholiota conissans]
DDAILIRVLKQQKDLGNTSGAGWKQQVWHAVAAALSTSEASKGAPKTAAKCSDHWSNVSLKKNFMDVHALRTASGFGWDDGRKLVTASESIWQDKIARMPQAKQWKTTPFPLYDDIDYLVHSVVATG